MTEFDPKTITAEKSLWQIWRMARRVPRKPFNRRCAIVVALGLIAYAVTSKQSPADIATMVRGWTAISLDFAGTILGFLVAGFTIFATLSKPGMLATMAKFIEDTSGLTYLKYYFAIFFETFAWYVCFVALCFAILILGAAGGPMGQLTAMIPAKWAIVFEQAVCRTSIVAVGTGIAILCLELKSFVFNIYSVVMTSIRWECEFGPLDLQRLHEVKSEATGPN